MTVHPASGGRRANSLRSADWGALVDLDPRLSEGLLDSLEQAGVAAFVEPAAAVDTVSRAVLLPPRPLERLWVDPARAEAARTVVARELAELTALLAEDEPGATAHGLVQPVPRTAARRVLAPPALPRPPSPAAATPPQPPTTPTTPGTPAAPPTTSTPVAPPAPAGGAGDPADTTRSTAGPARPPASDAGGRPGRPGGDPVPGETDEDAAFRAIVAGFGLDSDDPVPRWPAREDLPTGPPRQAGSRSTTPTTPTTPTSPDAPGARSEPRDPPRRRRTDPPADGPDDERRRSGPWRAAGPSGQDPGLPGWVEPSALVPDPDDRDLTDRDEGHYEPPPPPPVPRLRLRTLAASAAVLLGLLVLFAPDVVGLYRAPEIVVLGMLVLGGGAGALVWWMRDSAGDDGDDGAVV